MISVRHLVKTFGELKAVDDISFDVRPARSSPSSGPTAPARPPPSRCSPRCSARRAARSRSTGSTPPTQPHEVRRRFGIVFQDPSLDGDLTAYENMELHGVLYHVPRQCRVERTETLLTLFELWDRRQRAGEGRSPAA